MNHPPQPSEAKPDLARTLRESCVHFTEAADESFFFRQIYLLLAALFGKIEDMFLLWREGKLPPPPIRTPATPTPQSHSRARSSTARSAANTARPIRVRRPSQAPRTRHRARTAPPPRAQTPRLPQTPNPRPIPLARPPPRKKTGLPQSQPHIHFITLS